MTTIVLIGVVIAGAGLLGVLWCIRHAAWLRRAELGEEEARAELNKLIFGHTAAIGTAFLGLGLLVFGIILN